MTFKNLFMMLVAICMVAIACEKEVTPENPNEETEEPKGSLKLELTDAPSDNPDVEGVFVTVAEVKLDGQTVEGFTKVTFDISAYQKGAVISIFDDEVEAGAYEEIELVFDNEVDADGNSPGCYVKEKDGQKYRLDSDATISGKIDSDFSVDSAQQKTVLLDFDLRKTIKSEGESQYQFVSDSEFNSGFKVLDKDNSGRIKGELTGSSSNSDVVVAYVYAKGEYDVETETEGDGPSNLKFYNAEASALVDAEGKFEVHYLDPGTYELHFASYKTQADGSIELNGTLELDALALNNIEVSTNSTINITLNILGLIDL